MNKNVSGLVVMALICSLLLPGLAAFAQDPAGGLIEPGAVLTLWDHPDREEVTLGLVKAFEQQTGVKVQVTGKYLTDVSGALRKAEEDGQTPDVMLIPLEQFADPVQKGLLRKAGPAADQLSDYYQGALRAFQRNGEQFGYPSSADTEVLYYSPSLLTEAPDTWDDIAQFAKTFNQPDARKYAVMFTPAFPSHTYAFFAYRSGYIFGDGGLNRTDIGLEKADTLSGFQRLDQINKSVLPAAMLDLTSTDLLNGMQRGRAAMVIGDKRFGQDLKDKGIPFATAAYPRLDADTPARTLMSAWGYTLTAAGKYPAAAQKLAEWLSTPEAMRAYEKVQFGLPARISVADRTENRNNPELAGLLEQLKHTDVIQTNYIENFYMQYYKLIDAMWGKTANLADVLRQTADAVRADLKPAQTVAPLPSEPPVVIEYPVNEPVPDVCGSGNSDKYYELAKSVVASHQALYAALKPEKGAKLSISVGWEQKPLYCWIGKVIKDDYGITLTLKDRPGDTSINILKSNDIIWISPYDLSEMISKKRIRPLSAALTKTVKSGHDPLAVQVYTEKQSLYAVPHQAITQHLYYRSDQMPKAPATWQDVLAFHKTFTSLKAGKQAFSFAETTLNAKYPFIREFTGLAYGSSGKDKKSVPSVKAVNYASADQLGKVLAADPDSKSGGYRSTNFRERFQQGKLAMYIGESYEAKWIFESETGKHFKVAAYPAVIKGKPARTLTTYMGHVISAASKYPKAAEYVLGLAGSREAQAHLLEHYWFIPTRSDVQKTEAFQKHPFAAVLYNQTKTGDTYTPERMDFAGNVIGYYRLYAEKKISVKELNMQMTRIFSDAKK